MLLPRPTEGVPYSRLGSPVTSRIDGRSEVDGRFQTEGFLIRGLCKLPGRAPLRWHQVIASYYQEDESKTRATEVVPGRMRRSVVVYCLESGRDLSLRCEYWDHIISLRKRDMNQARRSAAKLKPTNPNDRVTISIETKKKERFFANSEVSILRTLQLTEAELFREALKYCDGLTLADLFREGALTFARRKIAEANSYKLRDAPTRPGAANARLDQAYTKMITWNAQAEKNGRRPRKITAWTLSVTAEPITSWRTAEKWLQNRTMREN